MTRLFGTDGVRGVANEELTIELAMKLGKYGAYAITKGKKNATILIGKDTRISGDMLESALISGILSVGCNVVKLGVIPTPAVAKLIKIYGADAGIVISASHNPYEFNGIKFFNSKGFKLSDSLEDEIEKLVQKSPKIKTKVIGEIENFGKAEEDYIKYILETVSGTSFERLKVAVDCSNGAAYKVAPEALKQLGAKVYTIHQEPNGKNINDHCGSTHLSDLKQFVQVVGADLGLAFDGDADRLLAVDAKGNMIDGDKIMAICGRAMDQASNLNDHTIVSTVMSNLGFDLALETLNLKSIKTNVGDRYVLEEMVDKQYQLGGEQSGHIIFLDHNTTGDGLLTAVQLMKVMIETGESLETLARVMTVYPQVLKNAKVPNTSKYQYLENEKIANRISELESDFHGKGRVLIRPSGTEPLVRVMIEGDDLPKLEVIADELTQLIEAELNA